MGHPAGNRLLVAPAGSPLGPLQGPAQPLTQDHPDMAGVMADPGQLGDDHRHPLQGPQVGIEPVRAGALQQRLLDAGQVDRRQLWVGAGRAPAAQGLHPALLEAGVPDMGALAGHAELVDDLGLGAALGEQLGRVQPSVLKGYALILGLGRRLVGIAGPSHNTSPTVNPTHETQE
jgi:hypothetical protein